MNLCQDKFSKSINKSFFKKTILINKDQIRRACKIK